MKTKNTKLITVAPNGQISIGKAWAGRQVKLELINNHEIHIMAGTFVPESQATFHTPRAKETLEKFEDWIEKNPPQKSKTNKLFASLKEKASKYRG